MQAKAAVRAAWAGALALLLACACVAFLHGQDSSSGKAELEVVGEGGGRLNTVESELKRYKTKLSNEKGTFDALRAKQKELQGDEESLATKESEVRAILHETRDAITSLQYKVQDIKRDKLSEEMFSTADLAVLPLHTHTHTSPVTAKHEDTTSSEHTGAEVKKAEAAARLASKAAKESLAASNKHAEEHSSVPPALAHAVVRVQVVAAHVAPMHKMLAQQQKTIVPQPHWVHPQQPQRRPQYVQQQPQQRPQYVQQQPARYYVQQEYARAPVNRAAYQAVPLTANRGYTQTQLAQAQGNAVYEATVRAEQAQRQAYLRSQEYVNEQELAARRRAAFEALSMPALPQMPVLGPEAAAP